MVHPDTAVLRAYLDGRLSAGEAVRLEHHVAACAACHRALDRARAPARGEGHVVASRASPRRGPAPVALAVAAAVVLAVAVGAYMRTWAHRAPSAGPAAVAATPAPPPPSPPALPMAAPLRAARPRAVAAPRESSAAGPVPPSPLAARADSPPAAPDTAASPWREIGFAEAGRLLGRPPLAVPGLPIRRLARPRGGDTLVVVEQTLDSGTVLRLYERRLAAAGDSAAGRAVAGLRVTIEAALPADSLARLLALVE
jgi:hypothetical protein